ncbi:hypothetical protein Acr_02g0009530 [Actinidia rufa]|uniref:Uncharacterized protein n=1 Tax=Actinidia rufa TaxID=165716 RepID=A0A7J0E8A9_9ERIC|nr:hypothetical protein Acr_02g0009530 [Actinidia rufa]
MGKEERDALTEAVRGAERREAPSSIVKKWGLYELSHELICSSLWPINSEDRQRREEAGAEKCKGLGALIGAHSRMLCAEGLGERGSQVRVTGESPECHRSKLSNSEQIRSAQNRHLSIPRDSSLLYEAPAPNGFQIGVQTSPHEPFEVSARQIHAPHARQRKALSEFSRHSGFIRERGTTMAEQTSEFQRATGRGQKKRPEKRSQEGGHRGQEKRRDKKNCPRNKAQDQSSEAATTAMMAVDENDVLLAASADEESDWISDSGIAYHLCRDREWRNTQSFQGKQEKLQEKEDWKAIPTEGECPDRRAAVRHRSSGSTVEQERKEMLWDTCGSLARHEKVQPLQDVHEEAQRRETESMHNDRRDVAETSLFRSRSVAVISPVVHTREERWSHDDLQSDVLCRAPRDKVSDSCAEKMGKEERDALTEAVRGTERREAPSSIVKNGGCMSSAMSSSALLYGL